MSAKAIVKAFYDSDLANDESVVEKFFHKDCEMYWSSSQSSMYLNYNDILDFFVGTRASYHSVRFQFSHMLEDEQYVTSRHILLAKTIENPDDEVVLAQFSTIWEVKDEKLYRCHEMSRLIDEKSLEINTFSEIKI